MIRVLDRIAEQRGYPQQVRMDNGAELISIKMAGCADENSVNLEFVKPGKPTQNALAERFNRTYRTEVLDMHLFNRLSEVRELTER